MSTIRRMKKDEENLLAETDRTNAKAQGEGSEEQQTNVNGNDDVDGIG